MYGWFLFLLFMYGACIGSFVNCIAGRIVYSESVLRGRSRCDNCGHSLGIFDLIPVISWVISGGKCRYCGCRLSIRYLWTEMVMGTMAVVLVFRYGVCLLSIVYLILVGNLFGLSLVDWDTYLIPDLFHVVSIGLFLALVWIGECSFWIRFFNGMILASVVGLVSLACAYIFQKEMLGGGDIKLLFVCGLFCPLYLDVLVLFIASSSALIYMLVYRKQMIPFGPFLSFGLCVILLMGNEWAFVV